MAIPLLDLKREYASIREEVQQAWSAALASMQLLKGENVAAFEREIATYIGTPYAVGVASGTDALLLTVLGLGIGAGDELILHANAFAAAAEAVYYAGAQPVLVDVEADGLGPDPEAVARAVTPRTKAIMVVHLYGSPLQLETIEEIATRHHLALIEDCSHAHGAGRDGRKVGTFGRAGCFSAGVVKNLSAYGDAGFVTTADADLLARIRLLQAHGQEKKNQHVLYGFNSRLDELQAALLRVKLRHLDARNRRRQQIAAYYSERFAPLGVRVPQEHPGEVHVYHQYVIRTGQRPCNCTCKRPVSPPESTTRSRSTASPLGCAATASRRRFHAPSGWLKKSCRCRSSPTSPTRKWNRWPAPCPRSSNDEHHRCSGILRGRAGVQRAG
jgi:dTDP-4-amino-4,6-dideoxygalactose transaminase